MLTPDDRTVIETAMTRSKPSERDGLHGRPLTRKLMSRYRCASASEYVSRLRIRGSGRESGGSERDDAIGPIDNSDEEASTRARRPSCRHGPLPADHRGAAELRTRMLKTVTP